MRLSTLDGYGPHRLPDGSFVFCDRDGGSRSWKRANEGYVRTEAELIAILRKDPTLYTRMESPSGDPRGSARVAHKLLVDGRPLVP